MQGSHLALPGLHPTLSVSSHLIFEIVKRPSSVLWQSLPTTTSLPQQDGYSKQCLPHNVLNQLCAWLREYRKG